MEINIPLPHDFLINSYKELRTYLKQLELSVHYAQKVLENAEKDGVPMTDDAFVCFRHHDLSQEQQDDFHDELQNVSIEISIR